MCDLNNVAVCVWLVGRAVFVKNDRAKKTDTGDDIPMSVFRYGFVFDFVYGAESILHVH